ncbi:Hypothetical_protein [Hexamita inflata]|uniref:Hypothetical_protein n=1 Tax=Hexamita inflata TaxID=28002 RepID=A0AA86PKG2_9EUKA|nr:Hypothetical protein HINF_LOCUS27731 [Hexamita inflata]
MSKSGKHKSKTTEQVQSVVAPIVEQPAEIQELPDMMPMPSILPPADTINENAAVYEPDQQESQDLSKTAVNMSSYVQQTQEEQISKKDTKKELQQAKMKLAEYEEEINLRTLQYNSLVQQSKEEQSRLQDLVDTQANQIKVLDDFRTQNMAELKELRAKTLEYAEQLTKTGQYETALRDQVAGLESQIVSLKQNSGKKTVQIQKQTDKKESIPNQTKNDETKTGENNISEKTIKTSEENTIENQENPEQQIKTEKETENQSKLFENLNQKDDKILELREEINRLEQNNQYFQLKIEKSARQIQKLTEHVKIQESENEKVNKQLEQSQTKMHQKEELLRSMSKTGHTYTFTAPAEMDYSLHQSRRTIKYSAEKELQLKNAEIFRLMKLVQELQDHDKKIQAENKKIKEQYMINENFKAKNALLQSSLDNLSKEQSQLQKKLLNSSKNFNLNASKNFNDSFYAPQVEVLQHDILDLQAEIKQLKTTISDQQTQLQHNQISFHGDRIEYSQALYVDDLKASQPSQKSAQIKNNNNQINKIKNNNNQINKKQFDPVELKLNEAESVIKIVQQDNNILSQKVNGMKKQVFEFQQLNEKLMNENKRLRGNVPNHDICQQKINKLQNEVERLEEVIKEERMMVKVARMSDDCTMHGIRAKYLK